MIGPENIFSLKRVYNWLKTQLRGSFNAQSLSFLLINLQYNLGEVTG